ncbi:MAG: sensor histidine kinase [Chloroflexota bacterium]
MLVVLSTIFAVFTWQIQSCRLWHWLIPGFQSRLLNYTSNESIDQLLKEAVENIVVQNKFLGLSLSLNITSDEIERALIIDSNGVVQASYPISGDWGFNENVIHNMLTPQNSSLITKFQPRVFRNDVFCILSIPFSKEQTPFWFLVISKPINQLSLFSFSGILITIILTLPITALGGAIFGYIVSRPLVSRFRKIAFAVNNWARGNFDVLIEDSQSDEIGSLVRDLNYMSEQIRELLLEHQELAALRERNRLARDLHDSIKQQVFAVSLKLATVRHHLRKILPINDEDKLLENIENMLSDIRQNLTGVIYDLKHSSSSNSDEFVKDLKNYLSEIISGTDIRVIFDVQSCIEVSPRVEGELFYIFQEVISNVLRHSQAKNVKISMTQDHFATFISISDDGIGFDFEQQSKKGFGLYNIQERVELLGGKFEIISKPNAGTYLMITLPGVHKTKGNGVQHNG